MLSEIRRDSIGAAELLGQRLIQLLERVWFTKRRAEAVRAERADGSVFRVAARDDGLHRRVQCPHPRDGLDAAHAAPHREIENHHVEGSSLRAGDAVALHRLGTIGDCVHRETAPLQQRHRDVAHHRIVVHHQDASGARRLERLRRRGSVELDRARWQEDREDAASSDLRAHADGAAVVSHHRVRSRQTQPTAPLLGREVRVEDARQERVGNADARVADLERHVAPRRQVG